MTKKRSVKALLLFALINFWPAFIFFSIWACVMGFCLSIARSFGLVSSGSLSAAVTLLAPLLLVYSSYELCRRAAWERRAWVLYATWMVLMLEIGFLFSAAVGGTSMAVSDGGVSLFVRCVQYMKNAVVIAVISNVLVIPWVFICLVILKKAGEDKLFPRQD